jgi:hypothetical protein
VARPAQKRQPRGMPEDSPPAAGELPIAGEPAGAGAGPAGGMLGGEELLAAAVDIIGAATAAGATMRLLGGIAVYQLAPSVRTGALARNYHDYDVVVPPRQGAAAARVLRDAGYSEDQHFNALHGAHRMIFAAPRGFVVDVLVGTFQMCHRLDLGRELPGEGLTVHAADLLLTKLQIVQIEEKDLLDATALLLDLPTDGAVGIDVGRFVAPLAGDWGFYHTVERNLPRLVAFARDRLGGDQAQTVAASAARLQQAMEAAPKSLKWRMRAKVGEKVTWYELPEETGLT